MPVRKIPLANKHFYHIYNRSLDGRPIFEDKRDLRRFLLTINFYRFRNLPLRYSFFFNLKPSEREKMIQEIKKNEEILVEILSYAIMPNHYHLLLRQVDENGISRFVGNLQNSYARYYNTKNERKGHLFEGEFKAVLVESEEQLIHLARYIELNPLTSFIIKNFEELKKSNLVSLHEYLNNSEGICQKKYLLSHFKSISRYLSFLKNHEDYQKKLGKIKHLILEEKKFGVKQM